MRRPVRLAVLLLVLAVVGAVAWRLGRSGAPQAVPSGSAVPAERMSAPSRAEVAARVGRSAEAPAAELVERAWRWMGDDASEGACGPYRLITDVPEGPLRAACERIGERLDAVYRDRFGLEPVGEPAEAILLFAEIEAFRGFVREDGRVAVGYAGFAAAPEGYLALHADDAVLDSVIDTLAHELTHLVHRRALGPGLAPWLSEGLAEAVGDAAGPGGLEPLAGLSGAEGHAERLRSAYRGGEARALADLTTLDRSTFDRGVRSFDYEQSALFVRFLLLDAELAPLFRAYLRRLAAGSPRGREGLDHALGVGWPELERRFRDWLEAPRSATTDRPSGARTRAAPEGGA